MNTCHSAYLHVIFTLKTAQVRFYNIVGMSHECCCPRPPGTLHSPHQAGLAVRSDPCINNKGARRSFVEDYHPVPLKPVNLVGDIRQLLQHSAGPHPVAGTGHQHCCGTDVGCQSCSPVSSPSTWLADPPVPSSSAAR